MRVSDAACAVNFEQESKASFPNRKVQTESAKVIYKAKNKADTLALNV